MKVFTFLVFMFTVLSCSNDIEEVDSLFEEMETAIETAKDVEIIYSDSAQIRMKITSPTLQRKNDKGIYTDIFPDGIKVDFMNENKVVTSWLEAEYATRKSNEQKIVVKRKVKFYNKNQDKLETEELSWDQSTGDLKTDKFVRITQPSVGDTTYGYGFEAKQDFTRFKIKRNVSAIMSNLKELEAILEK